MSASRPLSFSWAVTTDKGLRRTSNEDSHCERSDIGLFVVADGMGGHVAGEVASREVVDAIEAFITDTASADQNRTWPFPFEPTLSLEANRLKAAFRLANRKIAAAIADSGDLRGMATTASALLADDRPRAWRTSATAASISCETAQLKQLTQDHSWVEEQVRAGTMSASAARQHPWRNVVTRALSGGEDPEVDVTEVDARSRAIGISSARTVCSRSSAIHRLPRFSATPSGVCRRSARRSSARRMRAAVRTTSPRSCSKLDAP